MTGVRQRPVKKLRPREERSPSPISGPPFDTLLIALNGKSNQRIQHRAILDTGAHANFATKGIITQLQLSPTPAWGKCFRLGDGHPFEPDEQVVVEFQLFEANCITSCENHKENFFILSEPGSGSDVVLGRDFIDNNKILTRTHRFGGFVAVQSSESKAKYKQNEVERQHRDSADFIARDKDTKEDIAQRREKLSNNSTTASSSHNPSTNTYRSSDSHPSS